MTEQQAVPRSFSIPIPLELQVGHTITSLPVNINVHPPTPSPRSSYKVTLEPADLPYWFIGGTMTGTMGYRGTVTLQVLSIELGLFVPMYKVGTFTVILKNRPHGHETELLWDAILAPATPPTWPSIKETLTYGGKQILPWSIEHQSSAA